MSKGVDCLIEPVHGARRVGRVALLLAAISAMAAVPALAQSEEIEPRTIGERGTTLVGLAGFIDKFYSSEEVLPINYSAQIDVARFVTSRFAVRGGLVGTGSVRGENTDDLASGPGAPALHALAGLLYYLTPESMVSLYGGAEYWAQLTRRTSPDSGSLVGKAGIQAVVSSRVSFFIEAGYGMRLTRDEEDQLMSRLVGQIGVRLKF
jgi:hypothetical protein